MMRSAMIALTAVVAAQPSAAQQPYFHDGAPSAREYLEFTQSSGMLMADHGVEVGPYMGHFQGEPASAQFSIYSVDFTHFAMSQMVNVTALSRGNFRNTRLNGDAAAAAKYRQAAYLASLFDTRPTSRWGRIHAAIWWVTSGQAPYYNQDLVELPVPEDFSTNGWYVISSLDADGGPDDGTGQEFLLRSVPEPTTFFLMASGLLLLAAFSRKRPGEIRREGR
jgi:hypothetical protein